MATYREILASETDPASPLTSTLSTAWAENPVAIAEGATGAPRHVLKSLQRLAAGTSTRVDVDRVVPSTAGSPSEQLYFSFGIMQIGAVRCIASGDSGLKSVRRKRNDATTTIASGVGDVTVDVSVLPGDELFFYGTDGATPQDYRARIQVDAGISLWPGAAAPLSGNDV